MFDRDRLFRVLYYLSIEENPFLIAQDGYETLRSCINQIKDVDLAISEMEERNELIDKEIIADPEGKEGNTFQHERNQITTCLEKLFEVRQSIELWSSFLTPLLNEAQEFWFCCPVDHTRCVGENKSPMDKWRHFKDHNISPEILSRIQEFQHHCGVLIHQHFQDLLTILDEEIQQEQAGLRLLTNRHARFLNSLPLGLVPEFDRINQSFIGAARFPVTHYHQVDPHFATLLGFSIARIFTFPLLSFGVNTRETDAIAKQLASVSKSKPTVAILFYRTVTRQVVGVHWEIVSSTLDDTHYARGVDITQEIEASRLKQTVSIQKMLRQWLHSIRNASFEQQARVILEEVQELEKKLETNEFRAEFESIYECVKLLMHTARTSVGLIDQALDTRGLTQHMCVSDFVSNITSFPHHFAQSEGIPAIYTRYRFLLNGNPAAPQDYSSFFVTGDIISLQSIVDNIISNAVRYTDPVLGIAVELSLHHQGSRLHFLLDVTDFAPGGLPPTALKFLQDNIGPHKCNDERRNAVFKVNRTISKGRSSRTGLPHIVELYHQLTASGGDDFDMSVTTRDSGTSFRMRFEMNLMAPASSETPIVREATNQLNGTVLVVDDSMVIRKIISRYLHSFGCVHQLCSDGAQAWDWFVANQASCAGVITDLEMPKMGGDSLIAKVHELCPGKPCFIVSGNDITREKLPPGAIRAIVKPITSDQIQMILCEVYASQQLSVPPSSPPHPLSSL